ncbi:MAG: DUF6057 family protein [Bacteroidales bacterium]
MQHRDTKIAILLWLIALEGYICFFRAHFLCLEMESCFIYLPSYFFSFFDTPGGIARYLSNFFIQFYYLPYFVEIIQILGASLWLFLFYLLFRKWKIPFRLIFWILFPIVLTLWMFFNVSLKFTPDFVVGSLIALSVLYGYYQVRSSILRIGLYFPIGIGLYLLVGIPSILWFIVGALVWEFIPNMKEKRSWKTAISVFLFTFFLVVSPYYIGPRFFLCDVSKAYQISFFTTWKHRGVSSDWYLYRTVKQVQYGIAKNDFSKTMALCDRFWEKSEALSLKEKPQGLSVGEQYFREWLSAYTKLSLWHTRTLNNRFLSYYPIPGMGALFPNLSSSLPFYNTLYMDFFFEAGAVNAARFQGTNLIESNGFQSGIMEKMVLCNIITEQYALAEKYLYYLNHTLFHRKFAQQWEQWNTVFASSKNSFIVSKRAEGYTDYFDQPLSYSIDDYIQILSQQNKKNILALDYAILCDLLAKENEKILKNKVPLFLALNKKPLPAYLQEAILISRTIGMANIQDTLSCEQKKQKENIDNYPINIEILNRYKQFMQAINLYQMGQMSPTELTKQFGDTYAFHFFFGQIIFPNENKSASSALSH